MKKIFKEFRFGHGAILKNRLVLAPMTTYSSNEDLTLSQEEEVYYKSRSKGMGMVITAATAVNKNAQAFYKNLGFVPKGVLTRQVKIDGKYEDEIFMELFLKK